MAESHEAFTCGVDHVNEAKEDEEGCGQEDVGFPDHEHDKIHQHCRAKQYAAHGHTCSTCPPHIQVTSDNFKTAYLARMACSHIGRHLNSPRYVQQKQQTKAHMFIPSKHCNMTGGMALQKCCIGLQDWCMNVVSYRMRCQAAQ